MNGIGGNSLAEVTRNLSRPEIMQWSAYRQRRGSLNIGRRVEQATGIAMAAYFNAGRKEHEMLHPIEFMPHEDDIIISFEEQLMDE